MSFSPAISAKATKAIGKHIRDWHLNRRSGADLSGLARAINAQLRSWINYYGAFYRSQLHPIAARIDEHLVRWAMRKFKRLRGRPHRAWRWLDAARQRQPRLFVHRYHLASTQRRAVGAVCRETVTYGSARAGGGGSLPLLTRMPGLGHMVDPLLAQSAIDRLLQSAAHELVLDGEPYRRRQKPSTQRRRP